MRMMHELRIHA